MSEAFDRLIEQRQARMKRSAALQRWLYVGLAVAAIAVITFIVLRGDPSKQILNPNTATAEQLITLPGVGPDLARKIIGGRPYSKPEDLLKVSGIGPRTLEKIEPRLRFD